MKHGISPKVLLQRFTRFFKTYCDLYTVSHPKELDQKTVEVQIVDQVKKEEPVTPEDTVKDSWDMSSSEDEDEGTVKFIA